MKHWTLTGLLALWMVMTLMVTGCGIVEDQDEPYPEEDLGETTPQIPEAIMEGEGQEPSLDVYLHEEGTVETMEFEEYIKGVVAGEMDPNWPEEALAAQAIIARSFTLHKINEDGGIPERDAHASTDIEEFQAYSEEDITETVENAVEGSRGEVAVYEGNFIQAWFHAFAGPKTATPEEGLGFEDEAPPYIQIVDSPGMDIVPEEEKNWEEAFSQAELSAAVEEVTGSQPEGNFDVEEVEEGPSGRTMTLDVGGVEVSAPELRLALGSEEMRSTYFEDIEAGDDGVTFSGVGFGHGVGMCQWGAKALVQDGSAPEEVVEYFYQDVTVVNLWD